MANIILIMLFFYHYKAQAVHDLAEQIGKKLAEAEAVGLYLYSVIKI